LENGIMAHETSWYIENRVIRIRFHGDLALEELMSNGDSIEALSGSAPDPLFLLIDLREVTKMPLDLRQVSHSHQFRRNAGIAWTIVISNNSLFNFFGVVMSKVTDIPMRVCETLEESNAFIAHNAPDLAPVLADLQTA
jgi:hypothetical protein